MQVTRGMLQGGLQGKEPVGKPVIGDEVLKQLQEIANRADGIRELLFDRLSRICRSETEECNIDPGQVVPTFPSYFSDIRTSYQRIFCSLNKIADLIDRLEI